MKPYRAGVVGCGRIGCAFDDEPERGYISTHAGAYTHTPEVELVALADLDQAKVKRYADKFKVPGRYTDYREMLACEQLDILSICTWNNTHREITRAAVKTGIKAIFCEKPIAESLKAADAMIQRCAESNVILMVNHQRRFDPLHQKLATYIREGQLGRIQQVTCYYTAGIANTGSHLLDLLRFFLGEVEWVRGIYGNNPSRNLHDPNIDGWLNFEGGSLVALQVCDVQDYTIFEINILGTLGRLRIMSHGFEVQLEKARQSIRFAGYHELYPAPVPLDLGSSHEYMLQAVAHLLDCLRRGQEPLCSGEDGRKALEIICALHESADAEGRRIHLPLSDSPILIESK